MENNIRQITDIEMLIKIRLDFLCDEEELPPAEKQSLSTHLRIYFKDKINSGYFYAYALVLDKDIVSVAFYLIDIRPPGPSFLNGRVGVILNVYTYPSHRGKGYASAVMNYLINDARDRSVSFLDLYATDMGIKLYKKCGFSDIPYKAMRLKL